MNTTFPTVSIDVVHPSRLRSSNDRPLKKSSMQSFTLLFHLLFGTVEPRTFDVLESASARILPFLCRNPTPPLPPLPSFNPGSRHAMLTIVCLSVRSTHTTP
ncbi:hypothetical protein OG21DRAFT_566130 [Imleria badia]|nr:hypothetical protein OG21DRAFT_566130 [Imleria badia]